MKMKHYEKFIKDSVVLFHFKTTDFAKSNIGIVLKFLSKHGTTV